MVQLRVRPAGRLHLPGGGLRRRRGHGIRRRDLLRGIRARRKLRPFDLIGTQSSGDPSHLQVKLVALLITII